jgi:hypothetical protein
MSIQQVKKACYRKTVERDLVVIKAHLNTLLQSVRELGWFSRYNDGLMTGWPGFDFFLLLSVQTGSGAHPASYPMGTEGSSPGCKTTGK